MTSARKMLLVPESEFRRLKQTQEGNVTSPSTILEEVKHPNERELVKKYTNIELMLQDPLKSDQEKVAEHKEMMNDFGVLKDRVTVPHNFKREIESKERTIDDDSVMDETIELLPPTLQKQARQLLNRLRGRTDLISWSKNGEVTIGGRRLAGSNITDLVGDVLRSRKSETPERARFLNVLAQANVPEEFVKNKSALSSYRKIKRTKTMKRPPGIPTDGWADDDDDDDHGVVELDQMDKEMRIIKKNKRSQNVGKRKPIKWKTM